MTKTVQAVYDGEVLRLEESLGLVANTRVLVTVELPKTQDAEPYSSIKFMASLNLDGPPDSSSRIDEVLYGLADD